MRKWLLLPLLIVPLVDAAVLAWLGGQIGWVAVVALVVLTALLGTMLVHAEGRRTIGGIQRSLEAGKPPTDGLIDGGLIIAAGALLLTPGLVTDLIGFLFVVPLTRAPIRHVLKTKVIVPKLDERTGGMTSGKVWTFGFPTPEEPRDVRAEDFDLGGRSGSSSGGGAGSSSGDTVDLGDDEYDVGDR